MLVVLAITALTMNGQVKITGTVVDELDNPLEFATVRIKDSNLGVNTDLNGKYEISVPSKDTIRALAMPR